MTKNISFEKGCMCAPFIFEVMVKKLNYLNLFTNKICNVKTIISISHHAKLVSTRFGLWGKGGSAMELPFSLALNILSNGCSVQRQI
ncbi:hypothetical protein BFP76_12230 [Amylibacter kogurei]|uniref:Uncharacterized protein n=1 Tax=Paramylibacter kogurei TaxID=1889778 RepID=A0A2G5KCT6_9RHOB|nr:hypothetical protein BFP76_12230 [Amylibacter kogurei]